MMLDTLNDMVYDYIYKLLNYLNAIKFAWQSNLASDIFSHWG